MNKPKRFDKKMDRRNFLKTLAVLSTGFAAACTTHGKSGLPTPYKTPTLAHALESPQVPATGRQTPTFQSSVDTQAQSLTLDQFLKLSSLLTGVENLDPEVGKVYLRALQSGATSGSALSGVYAAASSGSNTLPKNAEALAQSGFFEKRGMNDLAVQITDMWYSGVYHLNGKDHVATFVDALAWKTLHFTKPPTICGSFGFWASNPHVQISPDIQYTPVPTPTQRNQ